MIKKLYLTKKKWLKNSTISLWKQAVANLKIEPYMPDDGDNPCDNIHDIVAKYTCHPSIKKIKENVNNEMKFTFANIIP